MSNTLTAEVVYTAELAVGSTSAPGGSPDAQPTVAAEGVASGTHLNGEGSDGGGGLKGTNSGVSASPRSPQANGHPKPLVAKRALDSRTNEDGPKNGERVGANGQPVAGQPVAGRLVATPVVAGGTAALVAEPVYEAELAGDGAIAQVVDGLRLGLRRLATAAGLSLLAHCILLTLLGLFAAVDYVRLPPYLNSDVLEKEKVVLEIKSPKAEIPPPVVAKVETTPKTAGLTPGNVARGHGAAGLRGGIGGGQSGGIIIPGPHIEAPKQIASGGSGGLGTDKAFGADMMGEAGEGVPSGATFFGVKADGKSFAFVVDTSGSMSANMRYLRCREELLRSVGALHYRQKYFIVFFNHTIFPMPERQLVEARPNQLRQTMAWITGAAPVGFTDPWPGLLMAIRMKPDAIYLLTDGEFDTAVIEKVIAAQPDSKKIPIHTIAFESQAGEATLQTISRVTGGKYRYVP